MNNFLNEFEEIWLDDPLYIDIGSKIICYCKKNCTDWQRDHFKDQLTIGKIYEVIDLVGDKENFDINHHPIIIDDKGNKVWFPIDWFELTPY